MELRTDSQVSFISLCDFIRLLLFFLCFRSTPSNLPLDFNSSSRPPSRSYPFFGPLLSAVRGSFPFEAGGNSMDRRLSNGSINRLHLEGWSITGCFCSIGLSKPPLYRHVTTAMIPAFIMPPPCTLCPPLPPCIIARPHFPPSFWSIRKDCIF